MISFGRFALAAIFAGAWSIPAFAQYQLSINATPTGPGTCNSTLVTQAVTGTVAYNLPISTPNIIGILTLNGVPQSPTFGSQAGPFPLIGSVGFVAEPIPSTTPPYSFSFTAFPYANGSAQGTGFRFSGTCNVGGTAITSIESPFPSVPSVPSLPTLGLALQTLLLALAAGWKLARARVAE